MLLRESVQVVEGMELEGKNAKSDAKIRIKNA